MFSLARELKMTVKQLLTNMSSKELSYWMAYFRIEAVEMEMERAKSEAKSKMRR